ncbi:MAG: hypothetical protein V7786_01770 [Sulfitobacter litoralis]|uniref:hypothetical protein n=1 Tax=Sulfitobacter litoralis TaxID=335975 RepID=UPI00300350B2
MVKQIKAKVGTYEKNGETKGVYVDIGVIMTNQNGDYALLDPTVNLAGVLLQQQVHANKTNGKSGDRVMCSIFDNDNSQRGGGQSGGGYDSGASGGGYGGGGNPNSGRDLGDEIPFNYNYL